MTIPSTTLLSFLGVGVENRGYKLASYQFDCGFEFTTSFFGAAALARMRTQKKAPARWLIIGTTTSGWDSLYDCVAQLAPTAEARALDWALNVSSEMSGSTPKDRKPVSLARLREFEAAFSSVLGVDIRLITVEDDGDEIFAALHGNIEPKSAVVAEITHGFRTMGMNALLALGALRWLADIEVADILYGRFNYDAPSGIHPAISLTASARLAQFTPALAQLALMDDVAHIAPLFENGAPQLVKDLCTTQRLESLMQHRSAASTKGQALGSLRNFSSKSKIETACAAATASALERLHHAPGAAGLRARSEVALTRGDFTRALAYANEAIQLKIVELKSLRERADAEVASLPPSQDGDPYYSALNKLAKAALREQCAREGAPRCGDRLATGALYCLADARNVVMHADSGFVGKSPPNKLLQNEASLTELLTWSYDFYKFLA